MPRLLGRVGPIERAGRRHHLPRAALLQVHLQNNGELQELAQGRLPPKTTERVASGLC